MLPLVALLVPLAVIIEGGFIFAQRADLQTTADAAALAGAQGLLRGVDQAAIDAARWAGPNFAATTGVVDSDNPLELVTFNPDPTQTLDNHITVTVRKPAAGLFANGSFLSFGRPEVGATATARLGAFRLPGPGVFCIGLEVNHSDEDPTTPESISFNEAFRTQYGIPFDEWLANGRNPRSPLFPPPAQQQVFSEDPWDSLLGDAAAGAPASWYTVLRAGAGSGSNAGYVDIDGRGIGSAEQRRCYRNGSETPLTERVNGDGTREVPVDATAGIRVGPAAQGFTARGQAAYLNT